MARQQFQKHRFGLVLAEPASVRDNPTSFSIPLSNELGGRAFPKVWNTLAGGTGRLKPRGVRYALVLPHGNNVIPGGSTTDDNTRLFIRAQGSGIDRLPESDQWKQYPNYFL
jgi:hypothetical protein